uniref:Uncharacterized protein n=1 Tax=Lutzomyia longipalpis TaxID=7200 RepID=A0A1B0GJK1_LUTLO
MSDLGVVDEGAVEAGAAAESPGREIVVSPEEALSVREESKVEANEGAGSAQLGGSCEEFCHCCESSMGVLYVQSTFDDMHLYAVSFLNFSRSSFFLRMRMY